MASVRVARRAVTRLRGRLAAVTSIALLAGTLSVTGAVLSAAPAGAVALGGPVVLDGMDPVCHSEFGGATGGYIKAVLASLYAQAPTQGDGSIAILGAGATSNTCGQPLSAMMASYLTSITPTPTVNYYLTAGNLDTFFAGVAAHTLRPTVVWIPDNYGVTPAAALTAHASDIASFVNTGGGLFSNLNGYGWLTAILPNAVFNNGGCNGGPAVTAAGLAAFPTLTNALVTACWHGYFTGDTGSLVPLVDWPYPSTTRAAVAIGGASVTLPSSYDVAGPTGPQAVGSTVSVTTTVKNGQGVAMAGVSVMFMVTAGPDMGTMSTVLTNASGVATFALTGSAAGTDVVDSSAVVNTVAQDATVNVVFQPLAVAPVISSLVATDGSLAFTVTPGTSDPLANATGIVVTLSPGGATASLPATGGPLVFSGLTDGTAYTISAVTNNVIGASPAATLVGTPHPPITVTTAPQISGVVAGDGTVVVSITAPADNGGSPVTGYTVTASPGGAQVTVSGALSTATFTGLTNGVTYTFTVVATNDAGDSAASAPATATPVAPPVVVVAKPTAAVSGAPGLSALSTGPGRVTVTVDAPSSDGGLPITGYTVTLVPGGKTREITGALGGEVTFAGLVNGVTYVVTAVAHNAVGTSAVSPSLSGKPMAPPAAPAVRAATNETSTVVHLTAPQNDGGSSVVSYTVVLSAPGQPTLRATVPAGQQNVAMYGLKPGTKYTAVVTATNGAGKSKTRSVVVKTMKSPTGGVVLTQLSGHHVAVGVTMRLAGDRVFAFNSATLLPSTQKQLMKVIRGLHGKRHITCAGFTDFGGDNAKHEYDLGLARAQSVCSFFAAHGAAKVTRSVSFGGDKPLVLTGDHNARAQNRRVEVTFGH